MPTSRQEGGEKDQRTRTNTYPFGFFTIDRGRGPETALGKIHGRLPPTTSWELREILFFSCGGEASINALQ